ALVPGWSLRHSRHAWEACEKRPGRARCEASGWLAIAKLAPWTSHDAAALDREIEVHVAWRDLLDAVDAGDRGARDRAAARLVALATPDTIDDVASALDSGAASAELAVIGPRIDDCVLRGEVLDLVLHAGDLDGASAIAQGDCRESAPGDLRK